MLLCLACDHDDSAHLLIPPDDPVSQREARHFLDQAVEAKRRHSKKYSSDPKRAMRQVAREFSFANRPCVRGAIEAICPCVEFVSDPARLAEIRESEKSAYREGASVQSPEEYARSALNQELKRMERDRREWL